MAALRGTEPHAVKKFPRGAQSSRARAQRRAKEKRGMTGFAISQFLKHSCILQIRVSDLHTANLKGFIFLFLITKPRTICNSVIGKMNELAI